MPEGMKQTFKEQTDVEAFVMKKYKDLDFISTSDEEETMKSRSCSEEAEQEEEEPNMDTNEDRPKSGKDQDVSYYSWTQHASTRKPALPIPSVDDLGYGEDLGQELALRALSRTGSFRRGTTGRSRSIGYLPTGIGTRQDKSTTQSSLLTTSINHERSEEDRKARRRCSKRSMLEPSRSMSKLLDDADQKNLLKPSRSARKLIREEDQGNLLKPSRSSGQLSDEVPKKTLKKSRSKSKLNDESKPNSLRKSKSTNKLNDESKPKSLRKSKSISKLNDDSKSRRRSDKTGFRNSTGSMRSGANTEMCGSLLRLIEDATPKNRSDKGGNMKSSRSTGRLMDELKSQHQPHRADSKTRCSRTSSTSRLTAASTKENNLSAKGDTGPNNFDWSAFKNNNCSSAGKHQTSTSSSLPRNGNKVDLRASLAARLESLKMGDNSHNPFLSNLEREIRCLVLS